MKGIKLTDVKEGRNIEETLKNLIRAYAITIKELEYQITEIQKRLDRLEG